MNEGLSVADVVAMTRDTTGGNGGYGNGAWDNPFIYLVWLALLGGGGLWGNRGGGFGGSSGSGSCGCAPSCSDLYEGFNNQDVNGQLRGITNGLSDGFYAVNTGILTGVNGIQGDLCSGFNSVNSAISNLGFQMSNCCCGIEKGIMGSDFHNQAGFNALATQLAQCCCDTRYEIASQFCDTRNAISNATRDIIDSNNAGTRAILDFMVQSKLADKDAQIAELQRAASQDRQNALLTTAMSQQTAQLINAINPTAVPAYIVANPHGYGYGSYNSCGCGCGCG